MSNPSRTSAMIILRLALGLALCLVVAGAVAYVLSHPSPEKAASAYLSAWKTSDKSAMARLSAPALPQEFSPRGNLEDNIEQAISQVQFNSLYTTGKAVISGDTALVPAVANVNGTATARVVAARFPTPIDSRSQEPLARALGKPFSFNVGLIQSQGKWKVSQEATQRSLAEAILGDPEVKTAFLSLAGPLFSSFLQQSGQSFAGVLTNFGSQFFQGLNHLTPTKR